MEGISELYKKYSGTQPDSMEEIPRSVSTRRYFRIFKGKETCIGTYSPDVKETIAFTSFARHFRAAGINVPEVFAISEDMNYYIQSDLGDNRLHEIITARSGEELDPASMEFYKAALTQLARMQLLGHEGLDYSICVPRPAFDRQSVLWDLNHFKYYFLKPTGLPFDEQLLEDSFHTFADSISALPMESFMFRDFQTRNIMIKEGETYLIDFQGGRRGPLHYDLASLIYESKAGLTEKDRTFLIDHYMNIVSSYREISKTEFLKDFYALALIRALQVIGTYGLRGIVEKKAVFMQSIPQGLLNLKVILDELDNTSVTGYFRTLLEKLVLLKDNYRSVPKAHDGLTLTIYSFSFRKPLPDDITGNGGGFVYDCRMLNNPGRIEAYKSLNGFDKEVRSYLEGDDAVSEFLKNVRFQLDSAISKYQQRGYKNLMVSFGCTGGRHRSVYCAHAIAEWSRSIQGLRVIEIHREMGLEY